MSPVATPGPGVLRLIAVCVVLFGLIEVAWHHPVAVPPAARQAVLNDIAAREPGFAVASINGYWRPQGEAIEAVVQQGTQAHVDRFAYGASGLVFVAETVGRPGGLLPFLGLVALAFGGAWLFVRGLLFAFSPKCPHHRRVPLRTERVRAYNGGLNDEGLRLPAIDVLVQRCPRGDYVRRRVVEGPYNPTPDASTSVMGMVVWTVDPRFWRTLFRGPITDAQWHETFRSLKEQYEGEGPLN